MVDKLIIVIAIYGAVVSTTAVIWNILRDVTDKPKIRIEINPCFYVNGDGPPGKSFLSFSAINFGRRPVFLSSAGIELEDGSNIGFAENSGLPKKIFEGESHKIIRDVDELSELFKKHGKPKYAWYRDKTGRKYNSKRKFFTNYFR